MPAPSFFKGYRKVDLSPGEILLRIDLPPTSEHEHAAEFKQSHRRDDDIALVNAGMCVGFDPVTGAVAQASLFFGGMAAVVAPAPRAAASLVGRQWDRAALEAALEALKEDLPSATHPLSPLFLFPSFPNSHFSHPPVL